MKKNILLETLVSLLAVFISMSALSGPAFADGGFSGPEITETNEKAFVTMVDQRALMWVKDQEVELWLQDRYDTNVKSFGWIIPIPGIPEVDCIDEPLLDALDYETAPLFRENHWSCGESSGSGCGCLPSLGSEGASAKLDSYNYGDSGVFVWASSHEKCLDYSVISSSSANALINWLDERGFVYDEDTTEVFERYISLDFYFIVAEIKSETLPVEATANMTVRIRWPRVAGEDVVYPMALTGATAKTDLVLRLYVAGYSPILPANYASSLVPGPNDGSHTAKTYAASYDWTLSQQDGRIFAITYLGRLSERYGVCDSDDEDECANGVERPQWLSDVWESSETWNEIANPYKKLVLARLDAKLSPDAMSEDVVLHSEPDMLNEIIPSFEYDYPCEDDSVNVSKAGIGFDPLRWRGTFGLARVLIAVLLLTLAVLRRGLRLGCCAAAFFLLIGCEPYESEAKESGDQNEIQDTDTSGSKGPSEMWNEICDGNDNNANNITDEWWPMLGNDCSQGLGACAVIGKWSCSEDGLTMVCKGKAGKAGQEICNGVDDDCNGICDDGSTCCAGAEIKCVDECGYAGKGICGESCEISSCEGYPPSGFTWLGIEGSGAIHITALNADDASPSEIAILTNSGNYGVLRIVGKDFGEKVFNIPYYCQGFSAFDMDRDGIHELVFLVDVGYPGSQGNNYVFYKIGQSDLTKMAFIKDVLAPQTDETYIETPGFTRLIGVVNSAADDEPVLITADSEWQTLSRWKFADDTLSPPEEIYKFERPGNSCSYYLSDMSGDGLDDLILHCGAVDDSQLPGLVPVVYDRIYFFDGGQIDQLTDPLIIESPGFTRIWSFADLDRDGLSEIYSEPDSTDSSVAVIGYPDFKAIGSINPPANTYWGSGELIIADLDGDSLDEMAFEKPHNGYPLQETVFGIALNPKIDGMNTPIGSTRDITGSPGTNRLFAMDYDGKGGLDLVHIYTTETGSYRVEIAPSPAGCAQLLGSGQ